MSTALQAHAPSLRVLFAGLAKLTYERSRSSPPQLPRVGKARQVKRIVEGGGGRGKGGKATWIVVPGVVSFGVWSQFMDKMGTQLLIPPSNLPATTAATTAATSLPAASQPACC